MLSKLKHIARVPTYWYQAKSVKRNTPTLPEPEGDRQGVFLLNNKVLDNTTSDSTALDSTASNDNNAPLNTPLDKENPRDDLHIMLVGDSSAAGVGAEHQKKAVMMQLLTQLSEQDSIEDTYQSIHWQLHATTGHNSFDVLRRLYLLPASQVPVDILIITVGVNDVTKMQAIGNWKANLIEIVNIAQHKLQPQQIMFTAIPPIEQFPTLPHPLSNLLSEKANQLDQVMQEVCQQQDNLHYAYIDMFAIANDRSIESEQANVMTDYFAEDGFHPSELTYQLWAEHLAHQCVKVLN